jgi:Spy/CpxP family protein refolding chaperone
MRIFALALLGTPLVLTLAQTVAAQNRDTPFKIEPQITITPSPAPSPYVGFETRDVKTLSPERIEGLKRGAGLSYALAAELNGYPGPMHVLELAEQLKLDPEQKSRTQAIFDRMRRDARTAGEALIAAEAHLDRLFALRQVTVERVEAQTAVAAAQEARLRATHLMAHVAMMDVLRPEQLESYDRLRGYVSDAPGATNPGGGTHNGHHAPKP